MITCLRTIKIQLQAETSTGFCFLHMCNEFSQKMTKLVLIWRETSESASFSVLFDKRKISVPLRGRKKNKINNFNCSRPLSRDNGGMDKNPTLWCRSGCCSDSPYVLQSIECARLEIETCSCVPASDIWISCTLLSKEKITEHGFRNLTKCC